MFPADEDVWWKQQELLEKMVPGQTSGLTARQALTLLDYQFVTWAPT